MWRPTRISPMCALFALFPATTATLAQTPECPDYDPNDGIVWGIVRTSAQGDVAVPGADVVVRWGGGEARAQSLRNGIYIVCGVKTDVPVVVSAELDQFNGSNVPATLELGQALRVPLNLAFGDAAEIATSGRVIGRVMDRSTNQPIPNALVGAGPAGLTAVSDGAGRFQIDGVPEGLQSIQVRHIAFGDTETAFQMPSDGTLEIEVKLDPAVVAVDPLEVQIVGIRSHKLEMAGFYQRRDWSERLGLGAFMTRFEIEQRGAARVSHVLQGFPRVRMIRGNCLGSFCDYPIISTSNPACRELKREGVATVVGPSLYINGRRMRHVGGATIDDWAHPGDLAGIEVYTGSGDLPGEFSDANAQRCGAIVIWTGR